MAKLIAVCRDETDFQFERRQIPLMIEDALTMVMEIPETNISTHYVCENELKPFVKGYQCLSKDELSVALMVRQKEVFALLAHSVPCLGCRRSVERLYRQLVESQQPALEPLIITNAGILTISRNLLQDPKFIYALFYIHGSRLNEMVDNIPKSRRNRRCPLHSLETHKSRPSGSWIDVWDLLSQECRDEVVLIDSDALLDTLESYLRKHRFCSECKSKVLRAYNILAGDLDGPSEKGYCAALYDGLKSCPQERHIHVLCDTDFIAHLIGRAEPELAGGRERHAKTLDIAQEEVLTCLGIHLWERLHRLWQKLRAEEQTWQMLFFLGVDALRKHFEVSVENKNGISRLEQVVEEISEAERLKEMKREQKRLKKKARRREKCKCKSNGEAVNGDDRPSEPKQNGTLNGHSCPEVMLVVNGQEESCEEEDDRDSVDTPCSCEDLQCGGQRTKRATNLRTGSDCGYVSANKVWSGRETQDGVIGTCQRNERWESVSSSCLCPQDAELSSQESGKTKKGKSGNTKGKKGHPAKGTKTGSREKGVRAIDDEEKRLLQSMGWTSDSGSCKDCGSSDDELLIPEQEIERFRANQQSVSIQRQELREKLREKFQNMTLKEVPTMKGSHPLDSRQINGVSFGVVH